MKRIFLLITAIVMTCVGFAQTPQWLWASHTTGTGSNWATDVAVDANGNSYVTGLYWGSITFGATTLTTSNNGSDLFVAKADPDGNWLWARKFGGSPGGADCPGGINVDPTGNVYVTGYYMISPGVFGSITLSGSGGFLAKLDTNGTWQWARLAGYEAWDVDFDSAGNVYVTGSFDYTVYFGNIVLATPNPSNWNVFLAKIDPNGNWQWAVQGGGQNADYSRDLEVDAEGNSYITGSFDLNTAFGNTVLYGHDYSDILIVKADPDGNWLWAKSAGGPEPDWGSSLALDSQNNIYVTGYFMNAATFGTVLLTCQGNSNAFIAKLSPSGDWYWVRQAGCVGNNSGKGIAADASGKTWVTGSFTDSIVFGATSLTGQGIEDIFAAKLDREGNWLWAVQAGGPSDTDSDEGCGICCDSQGNSFVVGQYRDSASFGNIQLSGDGREMFLAKLSSGITHNDNEYLPAPAASNLLNACPNPFNTETTISYNLPIKGQVCLAIYNSKGQLVKSLLDEPQVKGEHSFTWNGKDDNGHNVASGLYFCRITSAGNQESRKLLLLK